MESTDQPSFLTATGGSDLSPSGVLAIVLVSVYSVAQGATVLRDLVYPPTGEPANAIRAGGPTAAESINSFGTLAGNVFAGAPTFVLLGVLLAGGAVYRGRPLVEATLLTVTLTLGVSLGVVSIYDLVTSSKLLFLLTAAFLLGVLYGGSGALVGAGVRYATG